MTQLMQPTQHTSPLTAEYERLIDRLGGRFAFLADRRAEAIDSFNRLGFPTIRHEEWRFTNLKHVAETPYTLAESSDDNVTAKDVARLGLGGVTGPLLVFVDSVFRPDLSEVTGVPAGVHVLSLADAATAGPDTLAADLARHAPFDDDALAALNTAFFEDGAYVRIDADVAAGEPIRVLFISTASDKPRMTNPRNLIVAMPGCNATVIEQYVAMGGNDYLSNALTEAVIHPNATLRHVMVEEDSPEAASISTLHVHQLGDSNFESHTLLLGGKLVRNNIHVELHGQNADSLINGLFMPHDDQHMDNHMRVVHAEPHCESRQFYHGILDNSARGVFTGRIVVAEGAQKTDAKQTNRNLLLSDHSRINAKPQLEIYADDVKCTHGATTGRLDEGALFYMRARGIPADDARALLVFAFAAEALERIEDETIRNPLQRRVIQRLPKASRLIDLD